MYRRYEFEGRTFVLSSADEHELVKLVERGLGERWLPRPEHERLLESGLVVPRHDPADQPHDFKKYSVADIGRRLVMEGPLRRVDAMRRLGASVL